ncbi:ATP-dependent DNA helicase [Aureococcus anophagefferens]|nr:ATP-dependent DNA helicase [Aureococcus anophagefferens]
MGAGALAGFTIDFQVKATNVNNFLGANWFDIWKLIDTEDKGFVKTEVRIAQNRALEDENLRDEYERRGVWTLDDRLAPSRQRVREAFMAGKDPSSAGPRPTPASGRRSPGARATGPTAVLARIPLADYEAAASPRRTPSRQASARRSRHDAGGRALSRPRPRPLRRRREPRADVAAPLPPSTRCDSRAAPTVASMVAREFGACCSRSSSRASGTARSSTATRSGAGPVQNIGRALTG